MRKHTWITIKKDLYIFKILKEKDNIFLQCQLLRKNKKEKIERRKVSKRQAKAFLDTMNNRRKLQRKVTSLASFVFELPDKKKSKYKKH